LPGPTRELVHFLPSGALGQALRDAFLAGTFNGGATLILLRWRARAGAGASRWCKWN
jgi:ABC-2 type transport system permease protein